MFCLEVWGDYALFTRPEMKVERVSYPVITPSACRAIFQAILWKPAIEWNIKKIEVLNPITWGSIRRNEVGAKLTNSAAKTPFYADDTKNRQQRASMLLTNVRYRIYASFSMTDKAGQSDNEGKFADMFKRRAKKGQCIYQPYLGCREFSCFFELIDLDKNGMPANSELVEAQQPIPESRDLGYMLYDMDFSNSKNPAPMFFHAMMNNGAVNVPDRFSEEVKR